MTEQANSAASVREACFVIMPIADRAGYPPGHFNKVYQLVIKPAIEDAGYTAVLASNSPEAVVIHIEILAALLKAPMALCDISDLNANVMFELGIRQAFDKPVVIIKDEKTSSPFDLTPIRYQDYQSGLYYQSVVDERQKITAALKATAQNTGDSVTSLVSLLGMQAAAAKGSEQDPVSARLEIIERSQNSLTKAISVLMDRIEQQNAVSRYLALTPQPVQNLGMFHGAVTGGVSNSGLVLQDWDTPTQFRSGLMATPQDPATKK